MAHILNSESRVFVLCVHPDHAVAQPAHGQDGSGWQWSSSCTRPGGKAEKCMFNKHILILFLVPALSHFYIEYTFNFGFIFDSKLFQALKEIIQIPTVTIKMLKILL